MHRYLCQIAMWVGCLSLAGTVVNGAQQDDEESEGSNLLVPPAPSAIEEVEERRLPPIDPNQPGMTVRQVEQMHGQAASAPHGFQSLFNGENLDGWYLGFQGLHRLYELPEQRYEEVKSEASTQLYKAWAVEHGAIVSVRPEGNLVSDQEFSNFELYLDWKLIGDGNSGVFLRGFPQVQICNESGGSGGLSNNTDLFRKPLINQDMPPGHWNRFHIRMFGNVVTVVNNGRIVVNQGTLQNYWYPGAPIRLEGPIELQNTDGQVSFRNLYIREIAPDEPSIQQVTLRNGVKVRVEEGGVSLNTVLIPMSYAKGGKIVLDGVYNEPLAAYVDQSTGDDLSDQPMMSLLEASSQGNQIMIHVPESLQSDETLTVHLQILGGLAQVDTKEASKPEATALTDDTK